jgi:hypothetical protein
MLIGFVCLFFASTPWIAVVVGLGAYLFEIFIDNAYARLTWHFTLKASWIVAGTFGVLNLLALYIYIRF